MGVAGIPVNRCFLVAAIVIAVVVAVFPRHAAGAGSVDNLASGGGAVMLDPTTYAIFWLPAGHTYEPSGSDSAYENLVTRYLTDVGWSSFYNIVTQYTDGSGHSPSAEGSYGGGYVDTTAYPSAGTRQQPLEDGDIQAEVSRAMSAEGWQPGPEHLFLVFTADGTESCDDSSNGQCSWDTYCTYHSSFTQGGQPVIYAALPDVNSNGASCLARAQLSDSPYAPNGDAVGDGEVSMVSKAQFAAITDPQGDGWTDSTGAEIGDKCDWTYGSVGSDGSNVTLNGHEYIVQEEWSNDSGSCSLGYGSPSTRTPVASPTATATSSPAASATPLPTSTRTPTPLPTPTRTPTPYPTAKPLPTRPPSPTPCPGACYTPPPMSARTAFRARRIERLAAIT
jgi:hypothetical protein